MEPSPFETLDFGSRDERRRRQQQERERFWSKLRRWREERQTKRQPETATSEQRSFATPETAEAITPVEKRKKRVGTAILKFIGIRNRAERPHREALQAAALRRAETTTPRMETPATPETQETAEWPSRVQRITRRVLAVVGIEESRARATAPEQSVAETQPDENIVQLHDARTRLADAAQRLDTAILKIEHSPSQNNTQATGTEGVVLPQASSYDALPQSHEQPATEYLENPAARLQATGVENAIAAVSRKNAERLTAVDRSNRERGSEAGAAVVVLAVATVLALRSRHRWKKEATARLEKNEELAKLAAERKAQLERNAKEINRLEREKVEMRGASERARHMREVVEVATSQTELTQQTAATLEKREPPASPQTVPGEVAYPHRAEHLPLPVTRRPEAQPHQAPFGREQPGEVAPMPRTKNVELATPVSATEKYHIPELRGTAVEAARANETKQVPVAAELFTESAVRSKEAPTEQEFSDRVERDPGRRGLPFENATTNGKDIENRHHHASSANDSSYTTLPGALRQQSSSAAPQWHQPKRGWLAVAIALIIIVGLILLAFTT